MVLVQNPEIGANLGCGRDPGIVTICGSEPRLYTGTRVPGYRPLFPQAFPPRMMPPVTLTHSGTIVVHRGGGVWGRIFLTRIVITIPHTIKFYSSPKKSNEFLFVCSVVPKKSVEKILFQVFKIPS